MLPQRVTTPPHLEHGVKALVESVKIGRRFPDSLPRAFPLTELGAEQLCAEQSEDAQEKEKQDEERDNGLDRIDQGAQQVLQRFPVPEGGSKHDC